MKKLRLLFWLMLTHPVRAWINGKPVRFPRTYLFINSFRSRH